MEKIDLLEKVLTSSMDENLKNDLLRCLFRSSERKIKGIPMLMDHIRVFNSDETSERMKHVAGGTGVGVAKLLNITPQGFNNQIIRKSISGNSIIDFHMKTGVSIDWLIGSWDGNAEYLDKDKNYFSVNGIQNANHTSQKYLSLVETYDQSSGNIELKWCVTKYHSCRDENNDEIPCDYGALLSLIIRYKDEAGTPERVKNGKKPHFQVRRVLAYVIADSKIIRYLDSKAKHLTVTHISGHTDRPGKTEFRRYSALAECLAVFQALAEQNNLNMIRPEANMIAWDYLIGAGCIAPQLWILNKLKEFRSISNQAKTTPGFHISNTYLCELAQRTDFSQHQVSS